MPYERAGATERRETMDYGSNSLNAHLRDYRRNTLLNTDYKILSRIIARRLNPVLEEHLRPTQYCVVPGNTITDATATVQEAIAFAKFKKVPLWVLSLDLKNAFDRISHKYLYSILRYGISDLFIDLSRCMMAPHLSKSTGTHLVLFRSDVQSGRAAT